MGPVKFQRSVISILTVVLSLTVSCTRAQDCQESPETCVTEQILSHYSWLNNVATSFLENPTCCERYQRTSLSEDGKAAQYNYVYMERGWGTKPINDSCTFQAVSSIVIDISCTDFAPTVYHLHLDYVNGNNCFVGHSNVDESTQTQYYFLITNPDSNVEEQTSCYNKLNDYTDGNFISLRDKETCKTIPPKIDYANA